MSATKMPRSSNNAEWRAGRVNASVMSAIRPAAVLGLVLIFSAGGHAHADEESLKLRAYRKPVDQAVDLGLLFLAKNQAKNPAQDGSFADVHGQTNAVAGLAGMAFLAKGYRPGAPPHGDFIDRTVDYILSTQTQDGYLGTRGGRMYGHSIATLYLSEVSGMVDPARQQKIDQVLPRAIKVILDAQKVPKAESYHKGGWRYEPDSNTSDMSITGWCIMALRSAKLNGAPVPSAAINDAMAFVDRCRDPQGTVRYEGRNDWWYARRGYMIKIGRTVSLSSSALLCRQLSGRHEQDVNRALADHVLKSLHPTELFDSKSCSGFHEYATYYSSQAMFQMGGDYWEKYAEAMYKHLLARQQSNGAWYLEGKGEVYPTAMYVLALTVSDRQLPIYQR